LPERRSQCSSHIHLVLIGLGCIGILSGFHPNRPSEGIQSGGDGGEIRDRRDGGRNMPGLGREHGRPERGNWTEGNHDANGSDQADSPKSDEDIPTE